MNRRHYLLTTVLGARSILADEENQRIRVGQIGTAHSHAAGKMTSLRALPELYEVAGLVDADSSSEAAFSGIKRISEQDLLADASVRAVLIETSLLDARRAALAAIRAGKHIHLDKPGAANHPDFKAMRLEAEQRGLTVQMGYMLRYNPAFELLFRAAREDWFGEITEIDASMGKFADPEQRAILRGYPGGGMFELGCHLVDAVLTLLGKPVAVHAFSQSNGTDGLPDKQLAVLEYPRATVTMRCNHIDPFGAPHRRFAITGTRGAMEIQPLESGKVSLQLSEAKGEYAKGEHSLALSVPKDRYLGEFRDLARVLRGERKLAWSAAHDIAVHETALRAAGAWE